MPELRVVMDEKLNRLLDEVVELGLYNSKAELVRSAVVYFLMNLGVIRLAKEKKS
jgi:Arc/MetJ-type ribon-helix-helix transcriptional regulator